MGRMSEADWRRKLDGPIKGSDDFGASGGAFLPRPAASSAFARSPVPAVR